MSGTTIGAGASCTPTFFKFSVFTVLTPLPPPPSNTLTPHFQTRDAALAIKEQLVQPFENNILLQKIVVTLSIAKKELCTDRQFAKVIIIVIVA